MTAASGGGKTVVLMDLIRLHHQQFNHCQWFHVCNSITDVEGIRKAARPGQMIFWDKLTGADQAALLPRVTCAPHRVCTPPRVLTCHAPRAPRRVC